MTEPNDDDVEDAAEHDSSTRREALRKAAIASGVAAATWAAPRVEGLSLRPDYAAAGTARGTFSFVRNNPFPGNVPFSVPTPSGNETIIATYSGDNVNGTINVAFNNMDPPFNSNCRITAFSGSAPSGVGNVRQQGLNNTQVNWDIYNPFWGNTNLADASQLIFTITC